MMKVHQLHQSLVFSGVGDAGLFQGGLGSNDGVVGEIDSEQVLHSNFPFFWLLALAVGRNPYFFFCEVLFHLSLSVCIIATNLSNIIG